MKPPSIIEILVSSFREKKFCQKIDSQHKSIKLTLIDGQK